MAKLCSGIAFAGRLLLCLLVLACPASCYGQLEGRVYKIGSPYDRRHENLVTQFLIAHNLARAKVGEPPLVWDWRVAGYAQWYANQRRSDCALRHSFGPFGENIFWGSGKDWGPTDAVEAWVSEKTFYNYKRNSCRSNEQCGHYTQIVWKQSQRLGCARVVCDNGNIFMTCNYDPPGNYIGQKPY